MGASEAKPLERGELLTAISNTIVGLLRKHYGRGPMKAKTYILDDIVVCVMRNGFTPVEQTMADSGERERIVPMRHDFQRMMGLTYKRAIEELTGRKVLAFLSDAHIEPDLTCEIFFLDEPMPGFGAAEHEVPVGEEA